MPCIKDGARFPIGRDHHHPLLMGDSDHPPPATFHRQTYLKLIFCHQIPLGYTMNALTCNTKPSVTGRLASSRARTVCKAQPKQYILADVIDGVKQAALIATAAGALSLVRSCHDSFRLFSYDTIPCLIYVCIGTNRCCLRSRKAEHSL